MKARPTWKEVSAPRRCSENGDVHVVPVTLCGQETHWKHWAGTRGDTRGQRRRRHGGGFSSLCRVGSLAC